MSSPVTEYHEEEALGKAYDSRLMRRLIRYAGPYRLLVAASLSLLAIEGLLQLVGPLLTQRDRCRTAGARRRGSGPHGDAVWRGVGALVRRVVWRDTAHQ